MISTVNVKAAALACVAAGRYPSYKAVRRFGARGDNIPLQKILNRLMGSGEVVLPDGMKAGKRVAYDVEPATNDATKERQERQERKDRHIAKCNATRFGWSAWRVRRAERRVRRWAAAWEQGQALAAVETMEATP